MIEIAALWQKETKNGEWMLSGKLGENRIYIVPNSRKGENTRAPDYRMYLAEAPAQARGLPKGNWQDKSGGQAPVAPKVQTQAPVAVSPRVQGPRAVAPRVETPQPEMREPGDDSFTDDNIPF